MKRSVAMSSRNIGKSTVERGVGLTAKIILMLKGLVEIYKTSLTLL